MTGPGNQGTTMTDTSLAPAAGRLPVTHPAPPHRIYQQCRESAAIAAGVASMANRAVDDGGASDSQLEHLSDLSDHLVERLEALAATIAEASADPRSEVARLPR